MAFNLPLCLNNEAEAGAVTHGRGERADGK
jgi:hypothetical protein